MPNRSIPNQEFWRKFSHDHAKTCKNHIWTVSNHLNSTFPSLYRPEKKKKKTPEAPSSWADRTGLPGEPQGCPQADARNHLSPAGRNIQHWNQNWSTLNFAFTLLSHDCPWVHWKRHVCGAITAMLEKTAHLLLQHLEKEDKSYDNHRTTSENKKTKKTKNISVFGWKAVPRRHRLLPRCLMCKFPGNRGLPAGAEWWINGLQAVKYVYRSELTNFGPKQLSVSNLEV